MAHDPTSETERLREEFWQHIAASYAGTNWERIAAQMLDALLAAVRKEEREKLATGLDTRLVPQTPYIVCARIELLAELAAALREGA